jgi:hypothetical protein
MKNSNPKTCAKASIKPNVQHHGIILFRCIVGEKLRSYKLIAGPDDEGVCCLTLLKPDED